MWHPEGLGPSWPSILGVQRPQPASTMSSLSVCWTVMGSGGCVFKLSSGPGERSCPCDEGPSTFSTRALDSHGWLFCECPDSAKLCGPHSACLRHHSMPPGAHPRPVNGPALLPRALFPSRAGQVCTVVLSRSVPKKPATVLLWASPCEDTLCARQGFSGPDLSCLTFVLPAFPSGTTSEFPGLFWLPRLW